MQRLILKLCLILGLLGLVTPAFAETRLALVIAQSSYGGPSANLPKLDNTPTEAKLIADTLASPTLGFTVTRVSNLTKAQLANTFDSFRRKVEAAGPDTVAFIYFTGHGAQAPGERGRLADNYLLGIDANVHGLSDLAIGGVSVREQTSAFELTRTKAVVFVVDACRSNLASLGFKAGSKGLAPLTSYPGMLIAYATDADDIAQEGVYAPALARELIKPGRTLGDTFNAIKISVAKSTANDQRPYNDDRILDEIYLAGKATAPPSVPAPLDRNTLDALAWAKAADEDSVSAYMDYLASFGSGRYAAKAKARIAVLQAPPVTVTPVVTPKPNPIAPPTPTVSSLKTLDARFTPASTRAPLLPKGTNPADLPDFALFRECENCPDMVVIPGGTFMMGSPQDELGRSDDEDDKAGPGGSQINVSIKRFAMSRFETTKAEYELYLSAKGLNAQGNCYTVDANHAWTQQPDKTFYNPGFSQTARDPAVCVDWNEGKSFAAWISTSAHAAPYRFPSASEWEYAARGGTSSTYYWGNDANSGCRYSNGPDATVRLTYPSAITFACIDGAMYTAPVGSFLANPFGLHDMTGNVWERVEDCYAERLTSTPRNGTAYKSQNCEMRVYRGGAWSSHPVEIRSAFRSGYDALYRGSNLGFRLARDL